MKPQRLFSPRVAATALLLLRLAAYGSYLVYFSVMLLGQRQDPETRARLTHIEQAVKELRLDFSALSIQQRLTRLETILEETRSRSESNEQTTNAILVGVAVVVIEAGGRLIFALKKKAQNDTSHHHHH